MSQAGAKCGEEPHVDLTPRHVRKEDETVRALPRWPRDGDRPRTIIADHHRFSLLLQQFLFPPSELYSCVGC